MDRRGGPQEARQEHRLTEHHAGPQTGFSQLSRGSQRRASPSSHRSVWRFDSYLPLAHCRR